MTKAETPPIVLRELLRWRADRHPDKRFAAFADGSNWTYAQACDRAEQVAQGLLALGVRPGASVFCWLPNGPELLAAWFGVNALGGVHVPCNLAWRGPLLAHALKLSGARVAIVHQDLLPRLAEVDLQGLQTLIVVSHAAEETEAGAPPLRVLSWSDLEEGSAPLPEIQPWDTMHLLFTSGTTGPSKAVQCSYLHSARFLESPCPGTFGPDATFLLVLPLFHAGGLATVYAVLRDGGSLAVPGAFKTGEFWTWVRRFGATSTTLVEQMAVFLLGQPPSEEDRRHDLQIVNIAPVGPPARHFIERFGGRLWTSYGSTEMGAPLAGDADGLRPRPGYQLRLADEHDIEVPVGAAGELLLRSEAPWVLASGYPGHADAQAAAWRNGWFHSGDVFTRDGEGRYRFLDRKKDAIRRRGENISCYEVEQALLRHPRVRAAAAYAVPANASEDEVMACLCIAGDEPMDWPELVALLRRTTAHYMVPRYFRQLPALPLTETGKVRKVLLREQGVTADSWDRDFVASDEGRPRAQA